MPKYLVESRRSGAGGMTRTALQQLIERANLNLREMSGAETQWIECFVGADAIYWIYLAPDEVMVREHARRCRLSVDRITEIQVTLDPTYPEE